MNNELQIFKNNDLGNVRTITNEEGIWFVGKDVAEILGYVKTRNAIANHVDSEDKKDAPIQGDVGGTQQMTLINESGLYSLIFKSKMPQAKEFKRWVTSEVLPSIRKTGSYSLQEVNPPTQLEEIATNTLLQIEYEANKLVGNIDKLDNYYIPKHKTKLAYNKIIKQCLAYNDSKENCKLAKELLLLRLGNYSIYEEVPVDVLNSTNTIALIYDICKNINISIGGIA
jgi:prophage antirepressor-like protein